MGLVTVYLSHYRRYPGQLAGLLLILICAAALWSGMQSLTDRAAGALAESVAALEPRLRLLRQDGEPMQVTDFARLRRAGLCVTPELSWRRDDGLELRGIDPLSADCLRQPARQAALVQQLLELTDLPSIWGTPEPLAQWQIQAPRSGRLYPLETTLALPGDLLLTDIAVVAALAPAGEASLQVLMAVSSVGASAPDLSPDPLPALPAGYTWVVDDYGVQPGTLADSFLLSLEALGWLALLVAALLVRSVYRLGQEQRRRSLAILYRLGIVGWRLHLGLAVELTALTLVGAGLGCWLGQGLATQLVEGFSATLVNLFSLDRLAAHGSLLQAIGSMAWVLLLVLAWASVDLMQPGRRAFNAEPSPRSTPRGPVGVSAGLALSGCLGLVLADGLAAVLVATAAALLGFGWLLPSLLGNLLAAVARFGGRPLLEWSCSEIGALCQWLRLPLLALALAIASVIGVQAMVASFESTFSRWLEQRLRGDLYVDPGRPVAVDDWRDRLMQLPGVAAVLPMTRGVGLVGRQPVDLLGVEPDSALLSGWTFLQAETDPWSRLAAQGVLVNEQLARRQALRLGDRIEIQLGRQRIERQVVAIYADYGRPAGELVLPAAVLPESLPRRYTSFVLGLQAPVVDWSLWGQLPGLEGSRWLDQASLRARAHAVFTRTFQITEVLNNLTLMLSALALLLMGIALFRLRRQAYTLIYVAGVRPRALRLRLLIHALVLTTLLGVCATPLGVLLSWVLVAKLNPAAFGWSLPLALYPGYWLQVWLICGLIGGVIGLSMGNPVRLGTLKNE